MSKQESESNSGRSILRFLIFPKKQLKYAGMHFLIVSFSILAINAFSYYKFTQLLSSTDSSRLQFLLAEYTYFISTVSLATLCIMGFLSFFLVIVFLHRFVGPVKPLVRHLDCILQGDYTHRTYLRPEDEINEIALKLNTVSEHLLKLEMERNKAI